jgi:tetratricopeptide (TPR) repeat protein
MASDISGTSDISWIKSVILKRYPCIVEDKGADLNDDNNIEDNEAFGDLDQDGTVGNDKDFWLYLERNKSVIASQIEFVGWEGKELSSDNIINHLLLVESRLSTNEDVRKAYDKINEIVAKAKEKVKGIENPKDMLKTVYLMLKKDFRISFKSQDNALFIDNLLRGKRGKRGALDCDTSTFLFLAVAHELKWPLHAVNSREHTFMRWDNGKDTFNFDYGEVFPDIFYEEWINEETAIKNGVYLRSLSQDETVGLFYGNRGYAEQIGGNIKRAIEDYTEAIRLNSKIPDVYSNRGFAKYESGDYEGAVEDCTKAISLDSKAAKTYLVRGQAKEKLGDLKGSAEDLTEYKRLNNKL